MADINITFTPVTGSTDINSYEVYVCDATSSGHFTTAAQLQTKLDAIHGGQSVASQGLAHIESITNLSATSITSAYTLSSPGNYHFGIASKNQGGFKVENDTAVTQLTVS